MNFSCGNRGSGLSKTMRVAAMILVSVGAVLLFHARAYAQDNWSASRNAEWGTQRAVCQMYGWCGGGGGAGQLIAGPDPCFLAQNAMRPCTSNRGEANGLDPHLVGTWELPFKAVPGCSRSTSTAPTSSTAKPTTASHRAGSFSAGKGHWSLKAKTGYADFGNYLYQAPDVFIATGQRGAVAWLRPALAKAVMRPCAQRQPAAKPVVDPSLVGTWKLPIKNGFWVWEISGSGEYKFPQRSGRRRAFAHRHRFRQGRPLVSEGDDRTSGICRQRPLPVSVAEYPDGNGKAGRRRLAERGRMHPGALRGVRVRVKSR